LTTLRYQKHKKLRRRNITLDDDRRDKAARIGEGNVSLGIARALDAYPDGDIICPRCGRPGFSSVWLPVCTACANHIRLGHNDPGVVAMIRESEEK